MKLIKDTLIYINKNLIYIIMFALLPSVFIVGLLNPLDSFRFITDYRVIIVNNFNDILQIFFTTNWITILNTFLAAIVVIVIVSALFGSIDNHFRSGKRNSSGFATYINNTILPVIAYGLIAFFAYMAYKFVTSLIIFAIHVIFSGLGNVPTSLNSILSFVVIFGLASILVLFLTRTIIAFMHTNVCGYSLKTSYLESGELLHKKTIITMFGLFFPLIFVIPLTIVSGLYNFEFVSNLVCLTFMFMYYPVFITTAYYSHAKLSRYDNIKRYYN